MIVQYKLRLALPDNAPVPSFWAYRLYAWLLSRLPGETAERLHTLGQRTVTQYIGRGCVWTVNLSGEALESFGGILADVTQIDLHTDRLTVTERQSVSVERPEEILLRGRAVSGRGAEVCFAAPTAFKQAGRYAIYPREDLLLQSLLAKWNEICPAYSLNDSDMLEELKKGVHIVDYNLRTSRFPLKDTAIPCFSGRIFLEARLPAVLQELWNALLCFAPYSGVGIKTRLGMGGVEVRLGQGSGRTETGGSRLQLREGPGAQTSR